MQTVFGTKRSFASGAMRERKEYVFSSTPIDRAQSNGQKKKQIPQLSLQLKSRAKAPTSHRYSDTQDKRKTISPPNAVAYRPLQFSSTLIAAKFSWRTLRSHFHQTVKSLSSNALQPQAYAQLRHIESAAKDLALPHTPPY
ncbi:MAG: hypothetical protein WC028_28095 [Candidatus Obscuribacterales bacterium]